MATWAAGERLDAVKLSTYAGEPVGDGTNSVAFTTVETVVDTITVPVVLDRRYKIVWRPAFFSTVANDHVRAILREDGLTGTSLYVANLVPPIANQAFPLHLEAFFTATATEDKTFVGTGDRISGTGNVTRQAAASNPTLFYVENA